MPEAIVETRVRLNNGVYRSVTQGEQVPDDDPVVVEYPALFGAAPKKVKKATRKAAD